MQTLPRLSSKRTPHFRKPILALKTKQRKFLILTAYLEMFVPHLRAGDKA